jgi:hypothetical protein
MVSKFNDRGIRPTRHTPHPSVWSYNWTDLITQYIAMLPYKPDYVIFNAGIWGHDLSKQHIRKSIVTALRDSNMTGIFKTTTTPDTNESHTQNRKGSHDATMCKAMEGRCLNLSWTESLQGKENYWDNWHFQPHVYEKMNKQLFDMIDELEEENRNAKQLQQGAEERQQSQEDQELTE